MLVPPILMNEEKHGYTTLAAFDVLPTTQRLNIYKDRDSVGEADSTYTVKVFGLDGVEVTVNPTILKFSALNQKASYNVTVKPSKLISDSMDT
ncbi:hypothetical protein HAX54_045558 [Datura stramonium]|uniref:Subtilisin-like protease fibronectin type-III domain-containing protein n=1 Tax=Datura stramonium TaxID=4076 RepID=A0ABS8WIE5_DATST|nr:hypothetical protein [Datura stramonium]